MLTDTHIHLQMTDYVDDLADVIQRSQSVGVRRWVVPAIGSGCWTRLVDLHRTYPSLYFAFGFHPWFLSREEKSCFRLLDQVLNLAPDGLVAVGECGLDSVIDTPFDLQLQFLDVQLELARKYQLPVILHCRKAFNELFQRLKLANLSRGGIWHGFSGSMQQAESLIDLGFKIGVGGVITYPRAAKTRHAVANLPASALVLETDGPTMPLCGYQGQSNEPARVLQVLAELAVLRKTEMAPLSKIIRTNTDAVFGFSSPSSL
jgi:TatD DNase family protein